MKAAIEWGARIIVGMTLTATAIVFLYSTFQTKDAAATQDQSLVRWMQTVDTRLGEVREELKELRREQRHGD